MNHFVELVAPFLLLIPHRKTRIAGGLIQILFQMVLISSGNLRYVVALFHLVSNTRLLTISMTISSIESVRIL